MPRGRPTSDDSRYTLIVNGQRFTKIELEYLKEYCTNGVPKNRSSTQNAIVIKILRAHPEWKMPLRMMLFRFAYGNGIVKL